MKMGKGQRYSGENETRSTQKRRKVYGEMSGRMRYSEDEKRWEGKREKKKTSLTIMIDTDDRRRSMIQK